MRKTFSFNQDGHIKPSYGSQKPELKMVKNDPTDYLEAKLCDKASRAKAVKNNRLRAAQRHIDFICSRGRDEWDRVYNNAEFRRFVGPKNWNELLEDMREIRGE